MRLNACTATSIRLWGMSSESTAYSSPTSASGTGVKRWVSTGGGMISELRPK